MENNKLTMEEIELWNALADLLAEYHRVRTDEEMCHRVGYLAGVNISHNRAMVLHKELFGLLKSKLKKMPE